MADNFRQMKAIGDSFSLRDLKLLRCGKCDGFSWYIGSYRLPMSAGDSVSVSDIRLGSRSVQLASNVVQLAYVDVTGTKLDGVTELDVIDQLKIDLYCGCTFAGAGESCALLRKASQDLHDDSLREHWFIGEDYAHDMFGSSKSVPSPAEIAEHLETETIPSIFRALVTLDVKHQHFNGMQLRV